MPAVLYSTVVSTVAEKAGSPIEQWTDQGLQATATLIVPWVDRYTLVNDLLENGRIYPHLTSATLRAVSAGISPHSTRTEVVTGDQINNYETAEVTVQYGTLELVTPGGGGAVQIFSEELTPNGEFLTLDHSGFAWASAAGTALKKEEAPGKLILSVDYVQTQFQVSSLHSDLISKVNHVNTSSKTSAMLGFTFPAETLLFAGSNPQRTTTAAGSSKWTVQKRFCYRPDGWNKFWRAGSPSVTEGFYEIYRVGGARYRNFPLDSFSNILI